MEKTETGNEPMRSKRDLVGAKLKKKYPDRDYADDEALFGQINDDYDEYDKELSKYKDRESRLTDLLNSDPSSAQFIADLAKGVDPWIAVIDRLGIDGVTDLINNPEKQAEYAAANKKYVERLAKEKDMQAEYEKNISESMSMLESMQKEQQLSDDVMDAAMDLVMKMANEAIVGKFSRETVEMALKAIRHDSDMSNARSEGMVAGRNSRIEEKLRKPVSGDGQPDLGGSNNSPTRKNVRGGIFELADEAR